MTYFFLESSAFVKLFIQEKGSDALIRRIEAVTDERKLVSPLASIEVRSAIRRRERLGDLNTVDAEAMLQDLDAEMLRIVQQPIGPNVLEATLGVLDRHPLRAMDALHLATCMVVRQTLGVTDIQFVSADEALLAAARAERFEVLNPI